MNLEWQRPYSPGPLTEQEFEQYWTDGFVIKKGVLHKEKDIQPCLEAVADVVDQVTTKLLSAGLISDPCSDLDVFNRLPAIEQQYPEASVLVHKQGTLPRAFADVWSHPRLLAIAQQLLGPAVAGHPTWNLRAATPRQAAAVVPWHQDNAYTGRDCWKTLQVTAWIPLMDVNTHTGCLQLLRGGHTKGKTVRHTAAVGDTWYVAMDDTAAASELGVDFQTDVVTAEMSAGDVLLFNNIIPHRSLTNISSSMRWSLDLRWQNPAKPSGAFGLKSLLPMTAAAAAIMAQQGNSSSSSSSSSPVSSSSSGEFVIPWEGWMHQSRQVSASASPAAAADTAAVTAAVAGQVASTAVAEVDEDLSPIIVGPWLDAWDLVHESKHTRAWKAMKQQQHC